MAHQKDFLPQYEKFKHKIFTYILYRVSFDREMAEDLTSEIFLKAYEHFDSYDEKRPFQAWIYTIAHNHLMNHFNTHRQHLPLDESRAATLGEEAHFVGALDKKLAFEKVAVHIRNLSDMEQTIIFLRFKEGLSHEEIAGVVDKSDGAVRVMLSRAIATLRQKLQTSDA